MAGRQPDRPPARATGGASATPRRSTKPTPENASPTGSGACWRATRATWRWPTQRSDRRPVRSHRGRARHGGRQLRLGSLGSGRRAIRRRRPQATCMTVRDLRRGGLARHPKHPPAPAPAQHQAALASRRPQAAQEREVPRRVGQPVERQRHLLLPARRPGGRRLRPLPEEKGQEHPLARSASRVEPFTTSLLDGIDLRETIRNWYEGRIYVRQFQKISRRGRQRSW